MSLVTCARVGDALTDWLDTASQLKKDALCEALGCGPTDEEIAAVFMNCDGVAHIPGTSIPSCEEMDAAISAAIEAIFTGGTDGQVWTKAADGTQGWADVRVSEDEGNLIELRSDGLYAAVPPPEIPECLIFPTFAQAQAVGSTPNGFGGLIKLGQTPPGPDGKTRLAFRADFDIQNGWSIPIGSVVEPTPLAAPAGVNQANIFVVFLDSWAGTRCQIQTEIQSLAFIASAVVARITNTRTGDFVETVFSEDDPLSPAGGASSNMDLNEDDTYCVAIACMTAPLG